MAVRKSVAVPVPAGSLLVADAAGSPALAAKKPSPPPIQLLCSQSLIGATVINGVCVLPSPSPAGVANNYIQPLTVSNPGAENTCRVISGTVPPGLSVLPKHGESMIVFGDARAGTFVVTVQATSPQGASATSAYSITRLDPRPWP